MVSKATYRLDEYRIIEYGNGSFWWESHSNFGMQRKGKCFIIGNILVIGKCCDEESGYLKLEFFEHLQKLPVWNKTRYYCFAFELLNIKTGQSLTDDFLEHMSLTGNTGSLPLINMSQGLFRFGKYQVTVSDNGDILWHTYEGIDRIIMGRCVIESGLLFMDPQKIDEKIGSKREFLQNLNQLPKWDKTVAWFRNMVLRNCQPQSSAIHNSDNSYRPIMDNNFLAEKISTFHRDSNKEFHKKKYESGLNWMETIWHRIHRGRSWFKYNILIVIVGILLGLITILYSIEKTEHEHHSKKQHHEHNDD